MSSPRNNVGKNMPIMKQRGRKTGNMTQISVLWELRQNGVLICICIDISTVLMTFTVQPLIAHRRLRLCVQFSLIFWCFSPVLSFSLPLRKKVNGAGDLMSVVVFQRVTPRCVLPLLGECSADKETRSKHNEQPGQMGHADPS